ncbi:MAG: esterase-like activity of phytase family protein [Acidobacteriota bacterium]|nr:esterase-like activity of phytase family protein [Acidobacteriota bacterium]
MTRAALKKYVLLTIAGLAVSWATAIGAIELQLLGQTEIPGNFEVNRTRVGGLSGLAYDPGCDLYYALSDDRGSFGMPRFYTLRVSENSGAVEVEFLGSTDLRGADGAPFSGGDLDPEAVALAADGTLYLSSEGVPHRGIAPVLARFGLDGSLRGTLPVPDHFLAAAGGNRGVRDNLGFEGLALSPDGGLVFVATENALLQDGPATDLDTGSRSRLLVIDLQQGSAAAEYLYVVEPVPDEPRPAGAFRTNGISEILALDRNQLLVLERSFSAGVGNRCRLFLVELEGATNILTVDSLGDHVGPAPTAVTKVLVADLGDLGIDPDNLEGMAFGPVLPDGRRVLVMVADNNFQPSVQDSQVLVFAVSGVTAPVVGVLSPMVHEIQGAGHFSPYVGRCVGGVEGVVTAILGQREGQAFWMQSLEDDGDPNTSEGVLVTALAGSEMVSVGDSVLVDGRVEERSWGLELSVTRVFASRLKIVGHDLELPEAVVLGENGRPIPRGEVASRRLREFEPSRFAADAFETLEGMRVRVEDPVVVGPTSRHGEIVVVGDGGRGSAPWTEAGGLRLTPCNVHPQRVVIDDALVSNPPQLAVGDHIDGSVDGILHYTYGSYKLLNTLALPEVVRGGFGEDQSLLVGDENHLTVATFNLENLWAGSDAGKFERLARVFVDNLSNPDIVAVQEVQDDTGSKDDGTVSAEMTLNRLVEAIQRAGGLRYEWRSVDPGDNQDGGQPGANIRTALLFNPGRVEFVDRAECGLDRAAAVAAGSTLTCSPGLVESTNESFAAGSGGRSGSRKPLVGEFRFKGRRLVVINLHLSSKGGDDPIFGRRQPPVAGSTVRRTAQARAVAAFAEGLRSSDPAVGVIVLGDFNDFEASEPLRALEAADLVDLVPLAPAATRYTYVYVGNSQVLDHVMVDESLVAGAEIDIVHVNADFPESSRASDHDSIVVRLGF